MKAVLLLPLLAIAVAVATPAAATPPALADPSVAPLGHEVGIRFLVGSPTGEFGDAVDAEGFGLSAHYGYRPVPAFTIGVGGDFMIYGSETRTYSLPLVEDFNLVTNNNMAGGHVFAQWRPATGVFQPYGEVRAGVRYLWTESKLEDEDAFNGGNVARKTNYDDFATFFGGGGGMLIRVHQGNPAERSPSVFIDLKVMHVEGSKAEYLTEGDVSIVNDVPVFDASKSETDLTSFELGVVLSF